jgi:hypothetical protein
MAFALGACSGSLQQRVVTAANASEITLVSVYNAEGHACVDNAKTRADALSCIAANDLRWSPVWTALDAVRTSDNAVLAWCGFLSAASGVLATGVEVPPVDGVSCGPMPPAPPPTVAPAPLLVNKLDGGH